MKTIRVKIKHFNGKKERDSAGPAGGLAFIAARGRDRFYRRTDWDGRRYHAQPDPAPDRMGQSATDGWNHRRLCAGQFLFGPAGTLDSFNATPATIAALGGSGPGGRLDRSRDRQPQVVGYLPATYVRSDLVGFGLADIFLVMIDPCEGSKPSQGCSKHRVEFL